MEDVREYRYISNFGPEFCPEPSELSNAELLEVQHDNHAGLVTKIENALRDKNENDIRGEVIAQTGQYRMYRSVRNGVYNNLLGNAIEDRDFKDIIGYAVKAPDRYFPDTLGLDLTSYVIKNRIEWIAGGAIQASMVEDDRHIYNTRIKGLLDAFDQFVAKDSSGQFEEHQVAWRHSTLESLLHAVKVRKIKNFIDKKYSYPLIMAAQKLPIESQIAGEVRSKLAQSPS